MSVHFKSGTLVNAKDDGCLGDNEAWERFAQSTLNA